MTILQDLYDDIVEAEKQGIFTHKAHNWLASFKNRIKALIDENEQPNTPDGVLWSHNTHPWAHDKACPKYRAAGD